MQLTTTSSEVMPQDQQYTGNGECQNQNQSEHIVSKNVFPHKEPRAVYIALRETKLPTQMQNHNMIENKNIIHDRINIMPAMDDNIGGEGIEYVTLEECRLIADENLVPDGAPFSIDGITDHLRTTTTNTNGVKVLVQPLFSSPGDTQQQVDQFSMPLQPNQLQVENLNLQSNTLLPISTFNPPLPTEPLPYEEALTIQRCVMETTSPNAKGNIEESADDSMNAVENVTYLEQSHTQSMPYNNQMQHQKAIYSQSQIHDFNTVHNGMHHLRQFNIGENEFEQPVMSSKIGSKQEASPPLSSSPTYSLSEESQYINASNAINNRSSRSISTNFDSNGPVSPSESSSSSGSQASSISSASKRPMSMEEKRLRQYSESSLIPNANISSTRARHQSDGNVHLRTRSKRFQTSRNSIDSRKSDMSKKDHLGKRRIKNPMPENSKDDKYWRRRAKNNEAAKRSREAKRQKEDEVLQKVDVLEGENKLLRRKLEEARSEIRVLKAQLKEEQA